MSMQTPLVFDIKRASVADGPGVRGVVFFKGCNLDCFWCHNPEGKRACKEMAFFSEKCSSCGSCQKVCKYGGREGCIACGACIEVCPAGAIKLYGKAYGAKELFDIISRDAAFYRATGGGVTFSGGECLLYAEYVAQLSKMCADAGISVAIDTAGAVPYESIMRVLPFADIFLYDIKCLDRELHKNGTGVDNALILDNLDRIIEAGKRVIVRTPLIPGFNDGDEIEKIKEFCISRALPHEILPYHEYGKDKMRALLDFRR